MEEIVYVVGHSPQLPERIMEYLKLHPNAADTVDGIASWWLGDEGDPAAEAVEHAVLELVDKGFMERRRTPDGAAIYGLSRRQ